MRRTVILGLTLAVACSPTSQGSSARPDAGSPDAGGADSLGNADGAAADGRPPLPCPLPQPPANSPYALRYDVLGYLPAADKRTVLVSPGAAAPGYRIVDASTGCLVTQGSAGPRVLNTTSRAGTPLTGDLVDLTALTQPGSYLVVLDEGSAWGPILVGPSPYSAVLPNVEQFLSVQRCGQTTTSVSQHAACHLFASIAQGASSGDGVAVADGYMGNVDMTTGPAVDVEGGWHDAGDYIKFVGTASFVLAVDLLALRDHQAALSSAGAGNAYAALKQEMRWGLDWLVKMVGGAQQYHQVSGANDHDVGWRTPDSDTTTPVPGYAERPVFLLAQGQGGNLLGRSAAALALGSQVFSDDSAYSTMLITLAESVYTAAAAVPAAQSSDPPDFYQADNVDDDMALAAAVLAQITSDAQYAADALSHARAIGPSMGFAPLYWDDVSSLAYLEAALAYPAGSAERSELSTDLAQLATPIAATRQTPVGPAAAFHYALDSFGDGTIEQSLGAAAVCLASKRLGGSGDCAEVARAQLHWLFGQNPFGVSFMVGVGGSYPQNVHHSLAQATGLTLTGAIVGGPTSLTVLMGEGGSVPIPMVASAYAPWSTDALLYDDDVDDYVVNEPAIDFTAPLVFDLAELLEGQ